MKSRVFIPSMPTRYDAATRQRVPSVDLNPAATFGDIQILASKFDIQAVQDGLHDMQEEDYILAVGDVILTAVAINEAWRRLGVAKLLRWDRVRKEYDIAEIEQP